MTAELERDLFQFLCRKYVQRADNRQRSMGLQYTEAETHDLARELARWFDSRRPADPMPRSAQLPLEPRRPESLGEQMARYARHPCDSCNVAYDRREANCPFCGVVNTSAPGFKR